MISFPPFRFGLLTIVLGLIGIIPFSAAQHSMAEHSMAQNSPPCNLTKFVPLRATNRYGIFGNDQFDTVVCGYLVTRTEKVWDETQTNAYFRIVQFGQDGFRQSLQAGINQGNSVNKLNQGQYELNLGCFKNNQIQGQQYDPQKPYITNDVQTRLAQSLANRPIALVLSFGNHPGSDCVCCNLAHTVRSY
jgi:hypothetical protein